jgi:hypothetical protein
VNREPNFDDLVGAETSAEERERLRGVHELLLEAGPPPELTPKLRKAPSFGVFRLQSRKPVRQRALLLLAAALSILAVFAAGYAVADHRGGTHTAKPFTVALKGTSVVPRAHATLEVWHNRAGNWPMTLRVVGLPNQSRTYYEVYLVREGKPWGSCGKFRVASSSRAVTLTLNAPYPLQAGDSWVVTRSVPGGSEPGQTVLRPVSA